MHVGRFGSGNDKKDESYFSGKGNDLFDSHQAWLESWHETQPIDRDQRQELARHCQRKDVQALAVALNLARRRRWRHANEALDHAS